MKIHTFYKLFPKLLTSYVNIHIIFIFHKFISSYFPKVLVRCHLGCLTCIATEAKRILSQVLTLTLPPRFSSSVHQLFSFMACVVRMILSIGTLPRSFLLVTCFVRKHLPSLFIF